MIKRTNNFVTIGGAIGLFSGLPIAWGTAIKDGFVHTQMPGWLYLICVCAAPISLFVIGLGAKGQDQHSTEDQIKGATEENNNKLEKEKEAWKPKGAR